MRGLQLQEQGGQDRTTQFETPPPHSPPRAESGASPARVPGWVPDVVEAAPFLLVAVLGFLLLRQRRWRVMLGRLLLCLGGAGAAGGFAFYATYLLGCRAMTCVDTAGIVPILAGVITGFVAGLVAVVVTWKATSARA